MVADEVTWLGNKAKELLVNYNTAKPEHKLRTFEAVENLWETIVRPELKNFKTMQNGWTDDATLPEDSVWFENWRVPNRD